MVLDKVFVNEYDAQTYIDEQTGVMGRKPQEGWENSPMDDWQVKPLEILEHLEDGEEYERKQAVDRAFSKLTPFEMKAVKEHLKGLMS